VRQLISDLKDTLQANPNGIGLAAPQINRHKRVMVVCTGTEMDGEWQAGPPVALINPAIIEASDECRDFDGCLSFPGLFGETTRPHLLRVTGMDEDEKAFDRVYMGFDSVIVHHELDHLDGVLFIDRIENWDDLYTLRKNDHGELVRVPVTVNPISA